MCGRYMVTKPPDAIRRLFGTQGVLPNFPPRYNVAPTQDVPVVAINKDTEVRATSASLTQHLPPPPPPPSPIQ